MRCLTDVDVQAVVDHEASEEQVAHAATCEQCRARVDARRTSVAALSSMGLNGARLYNSDTQ